ERRDRLAIQLRRVERCLPATIGGGLRIVRTLHVPDVSIPVVTHQLAVNEHWHMGFQGTGAITFRRNQARGSRKHEVPLLGGKKFRLVLVQLNRSFFGVGVKGHRHASECHSCTRRHQESSTTWWGKVRHFSIPTSRKYRSSTSMCLRTSK